MYTIYKNDTGEIKRTSETPTVNVGESAITGSFSSKTHYVKNGNAIPLPQKPNKEPVFDYILERWVKVAGQDPRPITDKRSKLLQDSDWTDTYSARQRLGDELFDQWQVYRQALRDLTKQPGYPLDIVWPVAPNQAG